MENAEGVGRSVRDEKDGEEGEDEEGGGVVCRGSLVGRVRAHVVRISKGGMWSTATIFRGKKTVWGGRVATLP